MTCKPLNGLSRRVDIKFHLEDICQANKINFVAAFATNFPLLPFIECDWIISVASSPLPYRAKNNIALKISFYYSKRAPALVLIFPSEQIQNAFIGIDLVDDKYCIDKKLTQDICIPICFLINHLTWDLSMEPLQALLNTSKPVIDFDNTQWLLHSFVYRNVRISNVKGVSLDKGHILLQRVTAQMEKKSDDATQNNETNENFLIEKSIHRNN